MTPEVVVVEEPEVVEVKPVPAEIQASLAAAMVQGAPSSETWAMEDGGPNLILVKTTTYVVAKREGKRKHSKSRKNKKKQNTKVKIVVPAKLCDFYS
jgi:hypothetical protein